MKNELTTALVNDYLRSHAGNGMHIEGIHGKLKISHNVAILQECDYSELLDKLKKCNDFEGVPNHDVGLIPFRGRLYYFFFSDEDGYRALNLLRSDELKGAGK